MTTNIVKTALTRRKKIMPARGPRRLLCVVVVTMSHSSKGCRAKGASSWRCESWLGRGWHAGRRASRQAGGRAGRPRRADSRAAAPALARPCSWPPSRSALPPCPMQQRCCPPAPPPAPPPGQRCEPCPSSAARQPCLHQGTATQGAGCAATAATAARPPLPAVPTIHGATTPPRPSLLPLLCCHGAAGPPPAMQND